LPWSERARSKLRSTGERVSARGPTRSEQLTPHELRIAILAAEGKTNREIAVQLFLSPKTIEWHLGHVYRKLGIRSRSKLARALEELDAWPSRPKTEGR
jgi:DNA-binding CsgD family transcriptional regulator